MRVHAVANVRRVPRWSGRGTGVIVRACLVVEEDEGHRDAAVALIDQLARHRLLVGSDRCAFALRIAIVHVRDHHLEREQPEAEEEDGGDAALEQEWVVADRGRAAFRGAHCVDEAALYRTYEQTFMQGQMPPRATTTSSIAEPRRRRAAARAIAPSDATIAADDKADLCDVRCIDAPKVESARRAMKTAATVERAADTFKVLGDPTRLRIVHALGREELCVCDLALLLEQSQSTVSHSLRSLRQMRLVRYRRVGKVAYYCLDDEHIARLVGVAFEHVEAQR